MSRKSPLEFLMFSAASGKKILIIAVIFAYALIAFRAVTISRVNSGSGRNSIFGDGFSDNNTISAARFFQEYGFLKTYFLPVHNYEAVRNGEKPFVYKHYPALPDILAGAYAIVLHSADERVLRIFPFLISLLLLFLIYKTLRKLIPDERFMIGVIALVLSNYFIAWADNLHKHLYESLIEWAYFFVLIKHHEAACKKGKYLVLLSILMLLGVNISFETPVFIGALTLGFAIFLQRKVFTKETVILGIMLLAGFSLHFWQNTEYLGSPRAAFEDLKKTFVTRATGIDMGDGVERKFGLTDLWQVPVYSLNRMERYFVLPGWLMVFWSFFSLPKLKQEEPRTFKIILALFLASISWFVVMSQHSVIHPFTIRHVGPLYAVCLSYFLPGFLADVKRHWQDKNRWRTVLDVLVIIYGGGMFLTQTILDLYLRNGFLYPHLGK
jgi:Dolichyl-phosphate-mannose-protein mannosyltransferase